MSPVSRRFRRRPDTEPSDDSDSDDSDDEPDSPAQLPDSSLSDLVQTADPGAFDQTFTDADALLDIQGEFDPVAGSKQAIPRIAYTITFNMVWNPDQQRWEPDEGNENGGQVQTSTSLSPGFGNWVTPLPDSSGILLSVTEAAGGGGSKAEVSLSVDEDGGTTADYGFRLAFADSDENSSTDRFENAVQPLPEGASVRFNNDQDPIGSNAIIQARAFPLG